MRCVQLELSRSEKREVPFHEVLSRMVMAYQGEPGKPSKFVLSVVLEEGNGRAYVRAGAGDQELDRAELADMKQVGDTMLFASKEELVRGEEPLNVPPLLLVENARKAKKPASRYMPVAVARWLLARDGGLCRFPGCTRIAAESHHTERFVLAPHHEPQTVRALCDQHHKLNHSGIIENESALPPDWRLRPERSLPRTTPKDRIDRRVREHQRLPRPSIK